MQFRAEQYYEAGLERMVQARRLYENGSAFALAMYCAGLAVESLLRAFRWTEDRTFEGRHDLSELLKASRLLAISDEHLRLRGAPEMMIHESGLRLRAAMDQLMVVWHNNLRFASESALMSHLKRIGRVRRMKGDPLKKNALDLIEAAQTVVDRGVVLWTSGIRS